MAKRLSVAEIQAKIEELHGAIQRADAEAGRAILDGAPPDVEKAARLHAELNAYEAALAEAKRREPREKAAALRGRLRQVERDLQAAYNEHGRLVEEAESARAAAVKAQERANDAWRRVQDLERAQEWLGRELFELESRPAA
ncbi:MAG: hypothetical protein IMX02_01685 [Limnochordaceae bacterium]|nr:hypothetical protein [Limnochordaceae bacterium]